MPCDSEKCSNTSLSYFNSTENWRKKINPPREVNLPIVPNVTVPILQETPVFEERVSISNADVKPVDKTDPEIQLPPEAGISGTYLDFSYNALVPVLLPNG